MRARDGVLLYNEAQPSDASTKSIDLKIADPVSAIELEFAATNGATSNVGNFLSDCVTKIEIVDGSEVLYSLSLAELEALHFAKIGKTPALFPSEWAGGGQRHNCLLMFGRRLWDPSYAIDFTRFLNPQLKITWNLAAIRAIAATAFATGSFHISAIAKIMEQPATRPTQYLMAKELDSFTSSASSGAEERHELPRDRIYRMLMTRHWVQLSDIQEITSDLKLTLDTDAYIAFNRKVQQLDAAAFARWGAGRIKHDLRIADNTQSRLMFNKEPDVRANWTTQNLFAIWGIAYQWSSEIKSWLGTHAGVADATVREMTAVEEGHALHATLPLPFGDMDSPDTWFDPRPYKKMELVFTSGGTAGSCQIVGEQVRSLI